MSTPPLLSLNNKSDSSPFQNLKPSLLLILLIISFTFLLSLSLCLLLRHLNRRCLGHLSPASHTATALSSSSNRVSPALSTVDSLPLFTFSSIKRCSTNSSGDCAVCLSKFEPQDQLRLLPLCCHAFHVRCIDTWLHANQTCPLCRSSIHTSEVDLLMATTTDGADTASFRLEIGSISQLQTEPRSSYSLGSFEYVVDEESEIAVSQTHGRSVSDKEMGAQSTQEPSASWLKDYFDRLSASLSSRASSFRSSGRFFTGSSRRAEIGEYEAEANRVGEEISEMFRWFSGV